MRTKLITLLLTLLILSLDYQAKAFYDAQQGRWLNRDPIGETLTRNLYGFVDNDGINAFDFDGLEKGAEALVRMARNGQSALGDLSFNPIRGVQILYGIPFSILSGDIFYRSKPVVVDKDNCNVVITVNGILNTEENRNILSQRAIRSPRYAGAQAIQAVNRTGGPILGWFTDIAQIIGDETGAIQTPSIQLADTINSVYKQFKKGHCQCGKIQVLAHSQGTMVFRRAWPLIDDNARKLVYYTGIGGETTIQGDYGLAGQDNYANYSDYLNRDWIPIIGNVANPLRIPTLPFVGLPDWISVAPPNPHWMEHSYMTNYDPLIQSLQPNGPLIQIK